MTELKELAERSVQLAGKEGADDALAEAIDYSASQVRFSNRQIDAVNTWRERHVALFVAVGRRVYSTDMRSVESLDPLVKRAVENARRAPISKTYGGIASGRFKYRGSRPDPKIVSMEDPSEYVHEAIAAAQHEGASDVGGTLYVRHERMGIASSGGASGTDEIASVDLSVRAFSQPEASGHAVCCTPRLRDLSAQETGRRAGELSMRARNAVQGEEGTMDMIMEPLLLGCLSSSLSRMMSALSVEIGLSMFAKKVGKRVASDIVTYVDDPTTDSASRRAFDHEGVPARRNVVIRDGVLKTYLHNTSTAKRFKTETTGNAGPLIPTLFTLTAQPLAFHPVVVPGDWDVEEMIRDTKRGLYLNNTWYTRYQNYTTGEFSTIPRDALLRIENGEIVGAVKNIRISDNMMNLWKSIDALSKHAQEVWWWDEASPPSTLPTARARNVRITRSA